MPLNPVDAIDKYINTAYDDIKLIADNLEDLLQQERMEHLF
jgi:hypothetical protein